MDITVKDALHIYISLPLHMRARTHARSMHAQGIVNVML